MEKNLERNNSVIVKCPHCGAEYTLDEIFIPTGILGKSSTVVKDALGKILYIEWEEEPDQSETFNCDFCKKDFSVSLDIKNKSNKLEEEVDFSKTSVSLF